MAGYRIEPDATQGSVRLLRMTPGQPELLLATAQRKAERRAVAQAQSGCPRRIFDIYVDDTLLIVRHERTYVDGCMGLQANGNVRLRNVQAYRYQGFAGVQQRLVNSLSAETFISVAILGSH